MRKKEPAELINEYYEKVHHLYPDVSFAQFNRICRTEFRYLKEVMRSGSLKKVRLICLGTFDVKKNRAKGMLRKTELMFRSGKIKLETRNYIQYIVTEYFKREYNEDLPLEKVDEL